MKNIIKNIYSKIVGKPEGLENVSTDTTVKVVFDVWYNSPEGRIEVGQLTLSNGVWSFRYADSVKSNTDIPPIIDFPDKNNIYESDELWAFFIERIPGIEQKWVKDELKRKNINNIELSSLLEIFSRETLTNRYVVERHV